MGLYVYKKREKDCEIRTMRDKRERRRKISNIVREGG